MNVTLTLLTVTVELVELAVSCGWLSSHFIQTIQTRTVTNKLLTENTNPNHCYIGLLHLYISFKRTYGLSCTKSYTSDQLHDTQGKGHNAKNRTNASNSGASFFFFSSVVLYFTNDIIALPPPTVQLLRPQQQLTLYLNYS